VLAGAGCATNTGLGSQTVTVDFGTTGCTGKDGRVRTGKLIYVFGSSTLQYRNPGFSMNVSSQNYVVDNYTVNIVNKTVTNTTPGSIGTGTNPGTNLTWAITASVNIVKPNSGGTITWSCNRTKELTNTSDPNCYHGQSTPISWNKAVVKLNGTAGGVNAKNESYSVTATNVVRDFGCSPSTTHPNRHPFVGGTILLTPGNRPPRLIDFGNGGCDFLATLTIKGNTYNITLK
jgi:hypothetical protein